MAKTTASAMGTKRYLATPLRKNMGTKTMQMEMVETKAGTAICAEPSMIDCSSSLPDSRLRLMFSIATVASSTRMPMASANPPRVMMLMVSCSMARMLSEVRMESGMETAMMTVERQLPRKTRIMMAVRQAAMMASRTTPSMAPRTKIDWSESELICNCGGNWPLMAMSLFCTPLMMSSVEDEPIFMMLMRTARVAPPRTVVGCRGL